MGSATEGGTVVGEKWGATDWVQSRCKRNTSGEKSGSCDLVLLRSSEIPPVSKVLAGCVLYQYQAVDTLKTVFMNE